MNKIINSSLLLLTALALKAEEKPNVIIILSDDQGYGDFSCTGNPIIKTPNLDKLYAESVRFDNFHVAPLSTPTRGQLMTGLDAMHNGASTVLSGSCIMRRDIITMPEVFKENGYRTGIFGKWHLGDNYPDRPMDRGFEKALWIKGWGLLSEAEFDNDYYKTRYQDSLTWVQSDKYCTDLWFDTAMRWMEEKQDKGENFFTYIALNAPHGPFQAPKEDYLSYCHNVDIKTAMFFGMIQNIDKNMARLDAWLEVRGLKENTMVVYMNDNGTAGGLDVYNANMREGKGSIYDGGHRAVCFVRWPGGNIGEPRTIDYISNVQDLLPTFIDLFDFNLNSSHQFDGVSLKPILKGQDMDSERMIVIQQGNHVNPSKYNSSVAYGKWRLVRSNELYNLENDPGQQTNIADQYPEILNKMKAYYDTWWTTVDTPPVNQQIPLFIGTTQENPVTLTSADWVGNGPNSQWTIANGQDDPNGYWVIDAKAGGKYSIELSRWPFHINRMLTETGPPFSAGGTSIREGTALNIKYGYVKINNNEPVKVQATANAKKIVFEVNIPAGINTLKTYFTDADDKYICGAYYTRIEKIP